MTLPEIEQIQQDISDLKEIVLTLTVAISAIRSELTKHLEGKI